MSRLSPLKKLLVELRYKPDLGFYNRMDAIGQELTSEFPDWERTPLTLEVRNRKRHRRVFLSATRVFFEVDDAESGSSVEAAKKVLSKVTTSLQVKTLTRVGFRQWFLADLGKTFAQMVDQFSERFLARNEVTQSILSDKTRDVAYVVDFATEEGWRYNLRMGPMTKSQWFSLVAFEPDNFENRDDGETLEKYHKSLPEHFIFIDIDAYQENQPFDKVDGFLDSVHGRTNDLSSKLIEYCRK